MNFKRLDQLLKFLEESPDDPFVLYALALEYKSTEVERSSQLFDQLLNQHPDYLPTYYQAALLREEINEKDKALNIYRKGMDLAAKQNDQSTHKELQAAYNQLIED
jgi:tetratricopeptide (TPR) repeat protein